MKEILATIDALIQQEVFPGCEFAVIDGAPFSSEVRRFCLGNRQILPHEKPLEPGLWWDLASLTKVIGAGTACIDLWLSGNLDIDAPLKSLYPAWHEETVTIRALLTHTSGIDPFIKNRNQMTARELTKAMNQLSVSLDKTFNYSDVNFILLGFMLEVQFHQSVADIINARIFEKWALTGLGYGPIAADKAVPTATDVPAGVVHDPKARVLGTHCGSAGLFGTLSALTEFVRHYLADENYLQLYAQLTDGRPLAWATRGDGKWLCHTGYTGTFILLNLQTKQAVIFLSNRVHLKDARADWILKRDALIEQFITFFAHEKK
ncbi:MAG: beta-lactamase family protein [Streptococcaceae bacterium]|jgi:CubicO group peptidase (beta-lactamase class C family)|nr:beta-lactamase family protein [Streptococcaceae bacterium]